VKKKSIVRSSRITQQWKKLKQKTLKGSCLSGGPSSVYNKDAYEVDQGVYKMGIPVLGICYGMQRIAVDFGGSVIRSDHHEYGKAELKDRDKISAF